MVLCGDEGDGGDGGVEVELLEEVGVLIVVGVDG